MKTRFDLRTKLICTLGVIGILASLSGCIGGASATNTVRQEINACLDAIAYATFVNDLDGVMRYIADPITVATPTDSQTITAAEFRAALEANQANYISVDIINRVITVLSNTTAQVRATMVSVYYVFGGTGKQQAVEEIEATFVKQSGQWKITYLKHISTTYSYV